MKASGWRPLVEGLWLKASGWRPLSRTPVHCDLQQSVTKTKWCCRLISFLECNIWHLNRSYPFTAEVGYSTITIEAAVALIYLGGGCVTGSDSWVIPVCQRQRFRWRRSHSWIDQARWGKRHVRDSYLSAYWFYFQTGQGDISNPDLRTEMREGILEMSCLFCVTSALLWWSRQPRYQLFCRFHLKMEHYKWVSTNHRIILWRITLWYQPPRVAVRYVR